MSNRPSSPRSQFIPDLTDEDVYDALGRLPGYLDITTDDFRDLYRLAYDHALGRLMGGLKAGDLMRRGAEPVRPDWALRRAAEHMSARQVKSSAVCDAQGLVVGVLSETDLLHWLGAATFLELITQAPDRLVSWDPRLREVNVQEIMTTPAVTVREEADYEVMLSAFRGHNGRRMPVVDTDGKLVGMLARKDFLAACPFGPR